MVRYARQDPLNMRYQRLEQLADGYNLDIFKRGGINSVVDPVCSGTPLPSGIYIVETRETVIGARQYVFQTATKVTTGVIYSRYGDGNTWDDFSVATASMDAVNVSYDPATFPTPGSSTNVQTVLEELIDTVFPGGAEMPIYHVDRYGGDPTGNDECGAAFATAIALAKANGAGIIAMSAGTYLVGYRGAASLGAIRLEDNMMLRGAGMGLTTIKLEDIGNNDLTGIVRTVSGVENTNVLLRDFTIDGNEAGQTGWANVIGFYCGVTPDDRVHFDRNIMCVNIEIKNCRSGTSGSSNPGRGYGFDPHEMVDRFYALNCYSHDNGLDGFIADGVANGVWMGCRSEDNARHGFNFVKESYNGQVIGNKAINNGGNNYQVQQDSHHFIITGNYSEGAGEQGLRLRSGETVQNVYHKVDNNLIVGSGRNGINVTGAQHCTITNNTVINSSASADNTYFDISLDEDDGDGGTFIGAAYNLVAGNKCVAEASATNKAKAAIREDDAASAPPGNNSYRWNEASGHTQGKYLDMEVSTSTIIDAGYGAIFEAIHHGVSSANGDNGSALRTLVDLVEARGGGTIELPGGTLYASGTGTASQGVVALPSNVHLRGKGKRVTRLHCLDPGNNDVTGVVRTKSGASNSDISISEMTITTEDPSGTGAVTLLYIGGSQDTDILAMNLRLDGAKDGSNDGFCFRATSSVERMRVIGVDALNGETDGFYTNAVTGGIEYLSCYATGNARHGFHVIDSADAHLNNCQSVGNSTNQLHIDDSLRTQVMGGIYDGNGAGEDAIRIRGGSATDLYTTIMGAAIRRAQRDGISIAGANYNKILGNVFTDNGQAANNTYHDVSLELNSAVVATFNEVANNLMRATATNKTRYGVNEASGCDNNRALFNEFTGQVLGAVNFVGTASLRLDLANITLRSNVLRFADSTDATKLAAFDLSGISTATTQTFALPNKSGTVALMDDIPRLAMTRSNKDAYAQYTQVDYRRADETLAIRSVLSGTAPNYATRTETRYALDGTTVLSTTTYALTYSDGDLVSEEITS